MKSILEIPFAKLVRLQHAQDEETLFQFPDDPCYTNHLGTVAAAAQFTLAEFASGQWLLYTFPDLAELAIPVLRKSEVKFKKAAMGQVKARVIASNPEIDRARETLQSSKRTLIAITVQVEDATKDITMIGTYEWFIQLRI